MSTPVVTAFSASPLDRGGDARNDPEWMAARRADPAALSLAMIDGHPRLESVEGQDRLAWASLARLQALADREPVFLGLWKEAPVFACSLPESRVRDLDILMGPGDQPDMRAAAARLPMGDLAMAGAARGLFDWHGRNGFCPNCATATEIASGGWRRHCPACAAEHYPRVDPVCIMLPVYSGGAEPICLLGRQAAWPAGRMSALAGFMEPGESLEEACAREVKEEAGLTVTTVHYLASQPWPFPHQLMIGLIAEVTDSNAQPDLTELEAVTWLTRGEAREVLDGRHPDIVAPFPFAIAHTLLRAGVEGPDAPAPT